MLMIISQGVEISIAGGVEEIVRAQIPCLFFLFCFYYAFIVSRSYNPLLIR